VYKPNALLSLSLFFSSLSLALPPSNDTGLNILYDRLGRGTELSPSEQRDKVILEKDFALLSLL
jgi:hypothetical protein